MYRRGWTLLVAALLAAAATQAAQPGAAPAAAPAVKTAGKPFPNFTLARSDGSLWRLGDYAGQPKLVLFWATWCPYCRKLMPGIVALHREYGSRGLEVVAVNFRDDGDTDAYARDMGILFDIVLAGDALAAQLEVHGTPTVFVLDGDNNITFRTSASDPANPELRQAVAQLL